jgi:hypothetical protein
MKTTSTTAPYYASTRRGRCHPKPMEQYRKEWASRVIEHERKAGWALDRLEDAIKSFKNDPDHLGWTLQISSQAQTMERERLEADRYQRLIDGRPTRSAERMAHSRAFEARMNAEAHRERSGGWADDEFNARYDSVRERYSGGAA